MRKISFAEEEDDHLSLDLSDIQDTKLPSHVSDFNDEMKFDRGGGTPSSLKYMSRRDS